MAESNNEAGLSGPDAVFGSSYLLFPLIQLCMLFVMINSEQLCGAVVDSFPAIITVGDIFITRKTMK